MENKLPTLNLKELEKLAIEQALEQAGKSVAKASKLLGIGRATLYRRLREEGVPDTQRSPQSQEMLNGQAM